MRNRCWFTVVLVACACLLFGAGCGTKGPEYGGDDIFSPQPLEGDYALGERFENGRRITNVDFTNVHFEYDSYRIEDSEITTIERVADYLKRNAAVRLVTEGHCDERGSREYNMSLGEHRALAVRAYLIGLGVEGSRVQTRSYGEEMPLDPGHDPSAWRLNRRVEFVPYR